MTSFKLQIDKRRQDYVRLIGQIRNLLHQTLVEEENKRGLTKSEIAKTLNKDKSFVTRKLTGTSNMTLETLSDLAFAMDRRINIALPPRIVTDDGLNHTPPPPPKSTQERVNIGDNATLILDPA